MRNFDYAKINGQTWDSETMSYIAQIHEYKGKQELFLRQKPVELTRLVEIAKIQSTESSNQIEGIVTTAPRLKQLMADKTAPRNRNEEEILGYRNVLNLIHENYSVIPLTPNYILQLHKEMMKYTGLTYAGKFKNTPNEIDMITGNGQKITLFTPLAPYETPFAIQSICDSFQTTLNKELVDPLILIPRFILDFLCIHPFNDGNGRMSRLLTLLLLYRCNYIVGKYISIEKAIADTKTSYYDALSISDQGWHDEMNDPMPFTKYMLAIILSCYKEFENRITIAEKSGIKSTSYDIVKSCAKQKIGYFTKNEILMECPSLSSSSVEAALKKLVEEGFIVRYGSRRNAHYSINPEEHF